MVNHNSLIELHAHECKKWVKWCKELHGFPKVYHVVEAGDTIIESNQSSILSQVWSSVLDASHHQSLFTRIH